LADKKIRSGGQGPRVGLTTTIPVEIVYAAGLTPVDLNNLFIASPDPGAFLEIAENAGFPRTVCSWIKGIYGAVVDTGIDRVIAVTGGDCSNAVALAEVLEARGVRVHRFDYPLDRDRVLLKRAMELLMEEMGVSWDMVAGAALRLDRIREKLRRLDSMTFEDNVVSGRENHEFLVGSSDFGSDPDSYEQALDAFLGEAAGRSPFTSPLRLGLAGVPAVFDDIYDVLEQLGAGVVFNEVQRQFSIPGGGPDLVDRYLAYTYPYGLKQRLADIAAAVRERRLDGIIHYTQTFCHRQIHDILLRETLDIPVLTLEGDRPGPIDGRTLTRVETFLEVLS
jgi:benzoyl-CoA reductase/2-hydroxyglutaryl-CoA dehydratase subunit BcrC/BadD/HgdB